MRTRIRAALAASAVTAALALAGCGSSDSSDDAVETTEETAVTVESGSADGAASAKDDTTSSAQASATAAEIPDGYQEVTAPTAQVSFALPDSWQDISSLSAEEIAALAERQGVDVSTVEQQVESLDLFYGAPEPDENSSRENINVSKQTVPATSVPSQSEIQQLLDQQGLNATVESFSTVETANGEAAVAQYTTPQDDSLVYGALVIAPTSSGEYAIIFVSTGAAERAEELAGVVTDTIH